MFPEDKDAVAARLVLTPRSKEWVPCTTAIKGALWTDIDQTGIRNLRQGKKIIKVSQTNSQKSDDCEVGESSLLELLHTYTQSVVLSFYTVNSWHSNGL